MNKSFYIKETQIIEICFITKNYLAVIRAIFINMGIIY